MFICKIIISTCNLILLHVDINKLHVNIDKLHVSINTFKWHVDINYLCMGGGGIKKYI